MYNLNNNILQKLVVQSVGAVKLKDQMLRKHVLDAANHVLGFGLWKRRFDVVWDQIRCIVSENKRKFLVF